MLSARWPLEQLQGGLRCKEEEAHLSAIVLESKIEKLFFKRRALFRPILEYKRIGPWGELHTEG